MITRSFESYIFARIIPIAITSVLAPMVARAELHRVFVNGVEPAAPVTFIDAKVEIAADGSVYIWTKSKEASAGKPLEPESRSDDGAGSNVALPLEGRYWLTIKPVDMTASTLTLTIEINGVTTGTFAGREASVVEVTSILRRGMNRAQIRVAAAENEPMREGIGKLEVVLAPGRVSEEGKDIDLSVPIFRFLSGSDKVLRPPGSLEFELPAPVIR